MSLTYGRRYGLVGRNGLGKSTLLRTISRRQLIIPKHISILHVEQVSILLPILIMALTLRL
jgi:ATP-binding cassette subfamily F protein 3